MSTLTSPRKSNTMTYKKYPTHKYGNNPATLYVNNDDENRRYTWLACSLPPLILDPATRLMSGQLVLVTRDAIVGSTLFRASRVTGAWSGSTISWANTPDVTTVGAVDVTLTDTPARTQVSFDVLAHLQLMQGGAPNRGWRIGTDATTLRAFLNTGDFVPVLIVEYAVKPGTPVAASPANGQVVSVPQPPLTMSQPDPTITQIVAIRVEIDDTDTFTSPLWDSGELGPTDVAVADLADIPGAPSLSPGDQRFWRGYVKSVAGDWSDPSVPAAFSYEALGTIDITLPAESPDNQVTDPTPPIGWTTSFTQTAYRVYIVDPALPPGFPPLHDSGVLPGATNTYTPPDGVITQTGKTYRVIVRAWDDEDRATVGGVPEFVEASRDFTFELSNTVDPVTGLAVTDLDPLPFVKLTWNRSSAPDWFHIVRDGVIVETLSPADVITGGTSYEWVDPTAVPGREHTWIVRAVVNGVTSLTNPTVTHTTEATGVWLSSPMDDIYLPIITLKAQNLSLSEEGATHRPLNGKNAVRIRSSLNGYEGDITGELLMTELTGSTTGTSLHDQFLQIRESGKVMILSLGDVAFWCMPSDMTIAPTPHISKITGDYVYAVAFDFAEADGV